MEEQGRILIIDDSWVILERIKACLSEEGYEVRTTTGPAGAAKHVHTCDLAIVDFHMPGINGREVVDELRRTATEGACVFYLYTSDPEVASRYDDHGFDG